MTVKVSQIIYLMQKMSTQSNGSTRNMREYKIFEFKYGKTKLLSNC